MRMVLLSSTITAVAALLALAPVQAEEHEITTSEVEEFFNEVSQDATDLVRAGELERMAEWVDANFADGAVLQASMTVLHGQDRKGLLALTLDKDDVLVMGGMFAVPLGQMGVESFELHVEVLNVAPQGPGASTATTHWTERVILAASDDAPAAADAEPVTIEQELECNQLIQRDDERLRMGLMTCIGEVRF